MQTTIKKPSGGTAQVNTRLDYTNNLGLKHQPEWPEPQPLTAKIAPEPYPIDALPETIRAAIAEVHGFVKSPYPLVATSALGAISLAVQPYVDVERTQKLTGPTSLNFLGIAESGERKSTIEGFFIKPFRDYEQQQAEAMKPALERYQGDLDSWSAERDGILAAIKEASKRGKPINKLKNDLVELQHDKPKPLRVPKILLGDETSENLAWRLYSGWPSCGIVSSEAGSVLGSHGMSPDSLMRNLSFYNIMWDGGTHSIGRRTSESFEVKGKRLTTMLQVQEAALREFIDRAGILARGIGYFARFLIAWPESTQGTRLFTEAPEHWPFLEVFNTRISQILSEQVSMDEEGCLQPTLLKFSPEAKALWIKFHDSIEVLLSSGEKLYSVRDVASKSADNAARLAALFHVFAHGTSGLIGEDSFESASLIVAWHLSESRRFFSELALPEELADAVRLNDFLVKYCLDHKTHIAAKSMVSQCGPNQLRKKERLDRAIKELCDLDRLKVDKDGRRIILKVNPALA
jgi:hypothetical protein